jgi:MFS family permease
MAEQPGVGQGLFGGFLGKFLVLRGAARELWVLFIAKFLAILAYGVMNSTLVLWLSSDLKYTDEYAGAIIALWSSVMTLFTVMVGSLVDAIGLRRAFLIGFCVCIFARGMITFASLPTLALGLGLLPLALGEALMTPVMVAAVRRYSTTKQRSISFALFYALMNLGFFVGARIFDHLRKGMGEYGHYTLPVLGVELSTYRMLFLISFLLTIPNLILVYFCLRDGVEATDEGLKICPDQPKYPRENPLRALGLTIRDALNDTVRIFAGLWRQSTFYKFLAFLSVMVAVRLIFYHMYYTYPKFGIRELGQGAPIGQLWGINALLVIFLVPIVGAVSQSFSAYRMVVVGSAISAGSVFIMALPTAWFEPLAQGALGEIIGHQWLGLTGAVHPYYVMIVLFVALLSVGESIWSPRLYEYTAAIAPKGREASYMSLSYLPFLVAKVFVGMLSGPMLVHYCPAQGARASHLLWTCIAIMSVITPLGLIALKRHIRVKEAGREE